MATVRAGSDALWAEGFAPLSGLKIGFVGNHTSRLAGGYATHLAMRQAGIRLVTLFSPEHGAFGREDHDAIGDDVDPATGLPIHSLYGVARKPTPQMLSGLDALVFELQDVGARFYTYASTLLLCLDACHEAGVRLIVLDRPNPITGLHVEGPQPDADKRSFVASYGVPIRHGLTLGELARLAASERGQADALTVIACEGWRRGLWWDETGLPWIDPSPAMRSLEAATLYPGVCLLEQTNVSVGRGTRAPFLIAGAPWIDARRWVAAIDAHENPGVEAVPHRFTPTLSKYEGELCHGVRLAVTDRDALGSVRLGLTLIAALRDIHGATFEMEGINTLLANDRAMRMLRSGASAREIEEAWQDEGAAWRQRLAGVDLYG